VGWRAVHGCVRGRGHDRDGVGCDDRSAMASFDPFVAIALADGLGSARVGGLAARWAVEAALAALEMHPRPLRIDAIARRSLEAARDAVLALARELEVDERECGTTLMLAIARERQVAVAHVGDGVVVARAAAGWHVLSTPLGGEHANETRVLAAADALEHARILVRDNLSACALLTDGAAASLWERSTGRVAPALERMTRALRTMEPADVEQALRGRLCAQLRERTLDDCGVALLARPELDLMPHSEAPSPASR
jgi:hypothetical protein